MQRIFPLIIILTFSLVACESAPPGGPQTINILSPKDGETVDNPVTVRAAVTGVILIPAATPSAQGQGHLHILVDVDIPPAGSVVPTTPNHIHLGNGQTEVTLPRLVPGSHRITALFADSSHRVTNPILAYTVNIVVPGATLVPPKPGTTYP